MNTKEYDYLFNHLDGKIVEAEHHYNRAKYKSQRHYQKGRIDAYKHAISVIKRMQKLSEKYEQSKTQTTH